MGKSTRCWVIIGESGEDWWNNMESAGNDQKNQISLRINKHVVFVGGYFVMLICFNLFYQQRRRWAVMRVYSNKQCHTC